MEDETNKPILKVGDKVRIKSKEWFDSHDKTVHGSITPPKGQAIYFRYDMSMYCGDICTIKEIIPCSINTVKVDENPYNWGSWMFDLVDEEKKEEEPQYKVGDRVQINSLKWYNQTKDDSGNIEYSLDSIFDKEKAKYCGDLATIISISTRSDGNHYYSFKEVPFIWMSWMFSSAEWSLLPSIDSSLAEDLDIGDEILTIYGTKEVILDVSTIYKTFLVTYDDYSASLWMGYDHINSVLEYGKYKDYIDTSISNWTLRRCDFRDKLKRLETSTSTVIDVSKILTTGDKYNSSQSNSSKFDLTKVIYKSRRIR